MNEIVEAAKSTTDQPARPRRRWRRWVVIAFFIVIVGICIAEGPTVRRARELRIGQTVAEVERIMGPAWASGSAEARSIFTEERDFRRAPTKMYTTPAELWRASAHYHLREFLGKFGLQKLVGAPGLPVEVQFDSNGRVDWFRRGNTVVQR